LTKRCRAKISLIGKVVWDDELMTSETISPTISKLNAALKEANFPYRIKPIKCKKRHAPSRNLLTGKVEVQRFRSTVIGYKLVPR
jgi:hypothetical protein